MTTKKTTPKSTTSPAKVEDESVEDADLAPTGAEVEAREETADGDGDTPRKFTVEINGQDVELVDMWGRDQPPASLAMISKPQYAEKYMVSLLEQLIGEDQLIWVMTLGADATELGKIVGGWAEASGVKN